MTSAVVRLTQNRENGRKVVEISVPRRILTALRSMNPEAVRFNFGMNEEFVLGARQLQEAIAETYKERRRKGEVK
jgi:hypothetical protein